MYPGTTIGVKLTVVEKIAQERREPEDVAKGTVHVEVDDHEGETVAVATILTMVKNVTSPDHFDATVAVKVLMAWVAIAWLMPVQGRRRTRFARCRCDDALPFALYALYWESKLDILKSEG